MIRGRLVATLAVCSASSESSNIPNMRKRYRQHSARSPRTGVRPAPPTTAGLRKKVGRGAKCRPEAQVSGAGGPGTIAVEALQAAIKVLTALQFHDSVRPLTAPAFAPRAQATPRFSAC